MVKQQNKKVQGGWVSSGRHADSAGLGGGDGTGASRPSRDILMKAVTPQDFLKYASSSLGASCTILLVHPEQSNPEVLRVAVPQSVETWMPLPVAAIDQMQLLGYEEQGSRQYPKALFRFKTGFEALGKMVAISAGRRDGLSRGAAGSGKIVDADALFYRPASSEHGSAKPKGPGITVAPSMNGVSFPYYGRGTPDGDLGPGSAWINSEGDWGLIGHVSNHSIWQHSYQVYMRLLVSQSGNGNDCVEVYRLSSEVIRLGPGHHDERDLHGSGSRVDAIRDNYWKINYFGPALGENV
jgi:hypothetical protein